MRDIEVVLAETKQTYARVQHKPMLVKVASCHTTMNTNPTKPQTQARRVAALTRNILEDLRCLIT